MQEDRIITWILEHASFICQMIVGLFSYPFLYHIFALVSFPFTILRRVGAVVWSKEPGALNPGDTMENIHFSVNERRIGHQ